jgi:hypothetical protein
METRVELEIELKLRETSHCSLFRSLITSYFEWPSFSFYNKKYAIENKLFNLYFISISFCFINKNQAMRWLTAFENQSVVYLYIQVWAVCDPFRMNLIYSIELERWITMFFFCLAAHEKIIALSPFSAKTSSVEYQVFNTYMYP